jgi:glutamate dehydrogenase (NAD(P)+)
VPAALQDVIDEELAATTPVRLVVEGANLPTTPAAREVLHRRGVELVPDFIANAGGVVAAAHSMDVRRSPFPVDPAGVFPMISTKMRANAVTVIEERRRRGVPPHEAALLLAQSRVRTAMELRGQVGR